MNHCASYTTSRNIADSPKTSVVNEMETTQCTQDTSTHHMAHQIVAIVLSWLCAVGMGISMSQRATVVLCDMCIQKFRHSTAIVRWVLGIHSSRQSIS